MKPNDLNKFQRLIITIKCFLKRIACDFLPKTVKIKEKSRQKRH